jgi:hypothetical protein
MITAKIADKHQPNSHATTRSGEVGEIKAIEMWTADSLDGTFVYVDVVGKSGKVLNAGMRIPAETMDQIATQWLAERGKL